MNFYSYSKTVSPFVGDIKGWNANGKCERESESTYNRCSCRMVDTTEYSMDVLTGKMSRLTLDDKNEYEEVIVWKGNYIVCD